MIRYHGRKRRLWLVTCLDQHPANPIPAFIPVSTLACMRPGPGRQPLVDLDRMYGTSNNRYQADAHLCPILAEFSAAESDDPFYYPIQQEGGCGCDTPKYGAVARSNNRLNQAVAVRANHADPKTCAARVMHEYSQAAL